MIEKEKVLIFLRDNDGFASRSDISIKVFQRHLSASELDTLLCTVLNGYVEVRDKKWMLLPLGWQESNSLAGTRTELEVQPAHTEPISAAFARFKQLATESPEMSVQRAAQLCGRGLGDPLIDSDYWRKFRLENPEWYLQQPREWYASDVELCDGGYPLRYPTGEPLTVRERETRPTSDRAWFDRAMRMSGASLIPLTQEMSAAELANIVRVAKKIGPPEAEAVFGPEMVATAHRLIGLAAGENLTFSASSPNPLKP